MGLMSKGSKMKAGSSKKNNLKKKVSRVLTVVSATICTLCITASSAYASSSNYNSNIDWGDGGDILADVTNIISTGVSLGGAALAIFGLVNVGISIKDHNGPGIQQGAIAIVGGLIVVAGGLLFGNLEL